MQIQIYRGNALKIDGHADFNIVIDVIRAFTFSHIAFLKGVSKIYLMETIEEAFAFKRSNPSIFLAGEVKGLFIPGFDYDNSPFRLLEADLENIEMAQKTTNGVKATLNSLNADHVIVTGWTNVENIIKFVKSKLNNKKIHKPVINIIASHPAGDEDFACAEYIKGQLLDTMCPTRTEVIKRIENAQSAQKFWDEENPHFSPEDIKICMSNIESQFVMRVKTIKSKPVIIRELI